MATKKIAIDAGHGLNTPGKQTPDKIKEWTINDKIADKVTALLKDYDCEIIRTDNNEGNVDEADTVRRSTYLNAGVNAMVSIHHNAFTGKWNEATGVEVWVDRNSTEQDEKLAQCIYKRLVANTGLKGRGIKKENWTVIYQNKIPAVLCEGGFMDGSKDYKLITSDAGQTAYAKAVAEGLVEFLGLTKKAKPATTTTTTTANKETYRIRKTWADASSQIGAYSSLENAKKACKTGYFVFDSKGKIVYPITNTSTSTGAASTTSTATNVAAGTKLNLKNVALYSSSSASTKTSTKTGTFYAWSKEVVNNKIRITNSSANVGKAGQVTGWINYDDAKKSVVTTTTATATTATVKSLDDWAKEVIKGLYGNGVANRTAALKKAGCPYTYEQVQKRVEQLL